MEKILKKVKQFLLFPKKAFKAEAKTKLEDAFKYALMGLVVMGLLSGLIFVALPFMALPFAGPLAFVMIFALIVIIGFIGIVINGLWLHLWAYILGARKGVTQTLKVVIYSNTPGYYLGWIPFLGYITGIWSLVLNVIGLKQLQKLSTLRAVGAVLIAVVIPLIIAVVLAVWMYANMAPLFSAGPTGAFSVF